MNSDNDAINAKITSRYRSLLRECKAALSTPGELKLLRKAFVIVNEKSGTLPQRYGEDSVVHALAIAHIVASEMGMATTSVIAALFTEFVNHDDITIDLIRTEFGAKIAEITDGLAKISKIKSEKTSSQAENLRNLILTLARDVRVIFVKLAERLYIMRILDRFPREKQIELASETRYIYSPLAHRLGLYNMMSEMEDICMRYLEPEAYSMIEQKLKATRTKRNNFIRDFIAPLEKEISNMGLTAEIKGRPKAISSIWRKMKKQKVDYEEVFDKFAIRIIIDSQPENEKADCWRVYSLVTDHYRPNPERLRDWISVPKSNGYESLHTTVVVPGGNWVEVQIRSRRMNEIAEKGLAAHWKYKGLKGEAGIDEWLVKIRELLENSETDAQNVLDDFKLSLENKEIFVFTPQGDLKKFPEGATVLDFAFDIHTAVGASCVGARLNGRNVPIRHKLKNGDKVEILRSKNQTPNIDWLNFVATSKARSKIKQALKEEKLKEADHGREILRRRLKNWKIEFNDPSIRTLIKHYKYNDAIDLYYDIASENIDLLDIKDILTSDKEKNDSPKTVPIEEEAVEKLIRHSIAESNDYLVIDDRLAGVDYKLGKCCNPIFGDDIFGFVTVSSGITIHRINCPNAHQLINKYGYRVV
ncbi:MAG TPA: HD domain-containing protein, partial [Bacteroidales bacterium]|nr:HD domain-containing protein [Bacteroidales bacterium]